MEGHDQGYPMIVAVSSSCSASHAVVMGGFFVSLWRSWWWGVVTPSCVPLLLACSLIMVMDIWGEGVVYEARRLFLAFPPSNIFESPGLFDWAIHEFGPISRFWALPQSTV
jgi:hypothetical protein